MPTAPRRPMSGRTFRRLLKDAGISHQAIADTLEISVRSVRRYLSGESVIPRTVELAARWAVAQHAERSGG